MKVTIQRTSKKWKLLNLLSIVLFVVGIFAFGQKDTEGSTAFGIIVVAVVLGIVSSIGRWWDNS